MQIKVSRRRDVRGTGVGFPRMAGEGRFGKHVLLHTAPGASIDPIRGPCWRHCAGGHHVVAPGTATAAPAAIEGDSRCEVLVAKFDFGMGNQNGIFLALMLKAKRPRIRVAIHASPEMQSSSGLNRSGAGAYWFACSQEYGSCTGFHERPSDTSGRLIAADKVTGTTVYNHRGEMLGSVEDIMRDKFSGKPCYPVDLHWNVRVLLLLLAVIRP